MCEAKMHYAEVVVYFHYQKCLWLVNPLGPIATLVDRCVAIT